MSSADRNRSLWLTSRFLEEPEAAAAHRALAGLGAQARAAVLGAGDRLAVVSAALAQELYRHGPAAWKQLGAGGFERWLALGQDLAAGPLSSREAAAAFFAAPLDGFGPSPLETAGSWCALGRELAQTSRKLAGIFFRTTGGLLGSPDAIDTLRAWVEAGRRLYGQHGWQGEFLAQAYFSAAPQAVLSFGPRLFQLWAGIGAALHPVIKEREVFGVLPRGLQRWSEAERELFLRTTLALATVAPKQAHELYRELPGVLRRIAAPERQALLRVLALTGKRLAPAIADLLPVAGAVLQQVPRPHRLQALSSVEALAAVHPEAVVSALRSLPRLYEESSPPQVVKWFHAGTAVARENPSAGLAYFALESRTSLRTLHERSTAVDLEEAQGLLRKYIQMLSGEPVSVRAIERFRLLLPLEEFPGEHEVALPLRVDIFDTHEENFRVFRFLAAALAGRRELGTYAFVPPDGADSDAPPGSALCTYLRQSEGSELLEDLFLLAEGFRVARRLRETYRGLAAEASWVGRRLLERWSRQPDAFSDRDRWLDALFAFLLTEGEQEWPDRRSEDAVMLVARALTPLASAAATVRDSVRIAESLAGALAAATIGRAQESDALAVEKMIGQSLLESWFDEEAPGVQAPFESAASTPTRHGGDQLEGVQMELNPQEDRGGSVPLSAEELQRLIEAGVRLDLRQARGDEIDGLGLFITDLIGKVPNAQLEELRQILGEADRPARRSSRPWSERRSEGPSFYYDEWDYHIGDYRSRWCRLQELNLESDSGEFFAQAMTDYARLIPEVRRQFQRIRPEMYRTVRGLEDGEDFDLNAAIEARIELRARRVPSSKLYFARQREERDVATLFLVDMSASTDEPLHRPGGAPEAGRPPRGHGSPRPRRVIDVAKEALVVMAAALEEIGDAYAVYGFSGHGRLQVEFYRVKAFSESLNSGVKGRIGSVEPKRSTRMGAALRHAIEKMATVNARSKHLFLLSDGFPQDHDYGQDRRSNVYGIRDTTVALRETEAAGIIPFCITVDKAGHDYLREMCDESRYMVIEDITALPGELPKIYQRIVRP